jgi:Trk-type K+ transport system membrane component
MLPPNHKNDLSYIDSLFISTSALSVTGLSTIDVGSTLTKFGQILLMIEMQLGGIGILVLISYMFILMGKKMSLDNLWLVKRDQNHSKIKTIGSLGLSILLISLVIEAIGFIFMYPTIREHSTSAGEAAHTTAFHSIASFTNSGFDLFGNSLINFQSSILFISITGVLIFLGGIGYPTIMEYVFNFRGRKTVFTKVNVKFHFGLLTFATITYLLIEWNNTFELMSIKEKITNAIFLGAATRSGGMATVEIGLLDASTLFIMIGLMFIGGASTSTAGGIRLTTFAVIVAKLKSVITGNQYTVLFRKNITEETVNKSFLIFTMFIGLFFISTFLLTLFETHSISNISFETMSALTNTGLSKGITNELTTISKFILIFLMIIGRIGIFSIIYLIFKLNKKSYKYIDEDLIVG